MTDVWIIEILHNSTRRAFLPLCSPTILRTPPEPLHTGAIRLRKPLRISRHIEANTMPNSRPISQCRLICRPKLRHHFPRSNTHGLLPTYNTIHIPHQLFSRFFKTRSWHPLRREAPRARGVKPRRFPHSNRRRLKALPNTFLFPLPPPPHLSKFYLNIQTPNRAPPNPPTKHHRRKTTNG
jgi:hypothetical protein